MKKTVKALLFGILILSLTGCDPEYNYQFRGVVISDGKPLNNVNLVYHFLPLEDVQNWRSNVEDSILITNSSGEFLLNHSTVSLRFDSMKISITHQGFEYFELVSTSEKWDENIGINKKEIQKTYEPIKLIKIDSSTFCKKGIDLALKQAQNKNFIHHETLKFGQRNIEYWDKYERALKDEGISLKMIQLFQHPYPSNSYYKNECYLNETKRVLEEEFGKGWLEKIKFDIEKKNRRDTIE